MADVDVSKESGVLELRLNRPGKKNALTLAMYRELTEAIRASAEDASVRAILISSAGDTFCAGNDIADFVAAGTFEVESAPPMQFIRALVACETPIVAAVHGPAVGVGATMLLHCDLVYGSESARLSMPFVNLGLVPEAASSLLLPARVGHAVAAEMLFLGTVVDAKRAVDLGLLNQVLPSQTELAAFARGRALDLAAKPPGALRATRKLLWGDRGAVSARAEEEGKHFAERLLSPEAREAFMAFLERRAPDFSKLA